MVLLARAPHTAQAASVPDFQFPAPAQDSQGRKVLQAPAQLRVQLLPTLDRLKHSKMSLNLPEQPLPLLSEPLAAREPPARPA